MDFMPDRVRLTGPSNNSSKLKRASGLRRLFLKIANALFLFLGISKSVLFSILFRDFCKNRSRRRCRDTSEDLSYNGDCKMNFSALKRRLNPFEKRTKKDAKPKYTVYEMDSPPTLNAKEKNVPHAVFNNTETISSILPDPEGKIGCYTECTIKPDVHNPDCIELTYVDRDLGKGDNNQPFKTTVKVTKTDKGLVYHGCTAGDKKIERTFTEKDFPPFLQNEEKFFKANSGETLQEELRKKCVIKPPHLLIPPENNVTMTDLDDKIKKKTFTPGTTNTPIFETNPAQYVDKQADNPENRTQTIHGNKTNSINESPIKQQTESKSPEAPLEYDIISTAFQHAIIPEKLQAAPCGLAKALRYCYDVGLKQARKKSLVTDSIDDISAVLASLEKREKSKNKTPQKEQIRIVGVEAGYIQHECAKIQNKLSSPDKLSMKDPSFDTIEFYKARAIRANDEFAQLFKFLRRLRSYIRNKEKLPCLIIYQDPVLGELTRTLNDVENRIRYLKVIAEKTQIQLNIHSEEARKRASEQKAATQTEAQQTQPTANPTTEQTTSEPQTKNMPSRNSQSTQENVKTNVQPQIVTKESYNAARQKYWNPNKASDVKCDQFPCVNGLGGRRIITPMRNFQPHDTGHDLKCMKSNLDYQTNTTVTETGTKRMDSNPKTAKLKASSKSTTTDRDTTAGSTNQLTGTSKPCQTRRQESGDERREPVSVGLKKGRQSASKSGGGDGQYLDQQEVSSPRGLNTTSTPKKNAAWPEPASDVNKKTPNGPSRRKLLPDETTDHSPNVTNTFTEEDTEIVSSFCDGGPSCLETVDIDANMVDQGDMVLQVGAQPMKDPPSLDDVTASLYAKIADESAPMFRKAFSKPHNASKSLNSTFNVSMDSNAAGDNSRNQSDMSKSFTSYIETNNTLNLSSMEVKPGHGDRPNKKKLEAEIKPKKKKTRGTPNQHLDAKPPIPTAKAKLDTHVNNDLKAENSFDMSKDRSFNVSFKDDSFQNDTKPADSKRDANSHHDDSKPIHYKDCRQTMDQREMNMVPDQVHYRNESKLKEVEDMYTVSSGKNKKKKKRKEKKVKGGKPKDEAGKQSDEEDWFLD